MSATETTHTELASPLAPPTRPTDASVVEKKNSRIGLLAHEQGDRPTPTFSRGDFKINWTNTLIIGIPMIVLLATIWLRVPVRWETCVVFSAMYLLNGFGITLGYHRLFAHRAFVGHPIIQWAVACFGGGAFQGSIKWWARNHRIHHRYIDTDKDPYNAKRGFFFSHVGWMLMEQDYSLLGYVDISDLHANRIVRLQHKYYLAFALAFGVALPWLACGLWAGDWLGGFVYAVVLKMNLLHHGTFCINSLAHSSLFGASQNYSENHTSHDSIVCALVTLGEGYHNFHHEFAQDYRNGIQWYHWDPTKWAIRGLEMCGLARNLVRIPNAVIDQNVAQLQSRRCDAEAAALRQRLAAIDGATAPTASMTWADVHALCTDPTANRKLLVIGGFVVDLEKPVRTGGGYTHSDKGVLWYSAHPGGRKVLDMFVGKDATEAVSGTFYKHSQGAANLMAQMRVARLVEE